VDIIERVCEVIGAYGGGDRGLPIFLMRLRFEMGKRKRVGDQSLYLKHKNA